MKHLGWKINLAILTCGWLLSACTLFSNEPAPPIVLPTSASQVDVPTLAPDLEPEPVNATSVPTEVGAENPTATAAPSEGSQEEAPTAPPAPAADSCIPPAPPAGVGTTAYAVQPGDTLFSIGQNTTPSMTIEQIAAANCLTDVNRIEVGQQLTVWNSPAAGVERPVTQVAFEQELVRDWQIYDYTGPLLAAEHLFTFTGEAGNFFTIENYGPPAQNLIYKLQQADGTVVGELNSTMRNFFSPTLNGAEFTLPKSGEYEIVIRGQQNMAIEFQLTTGQGYYQSRLADPVAIQFEPGATSAQISGNTPPGSINRYSFVAFAGQTVSLQPVEGIIGLVLEDDGRNRLNEATIDPAQVQLPADGEYTLIVCHCFGDGIGSGPFAFDISIEAQSAEAPTPQPAAQPEPETLIFIENVMAGVFADAAGTLDASGSKTYQFNLPQGGTFTINDSSNSDLAFELVELGSGAQAGTFSTDERNHLYPDIRMGSVSINEANAYLLKITGAPNASYASFLTLGLPPHPKMVTPERFNFEPGETIGTVSGEIVADQFGQGGIDRYLFTAAAGQELSIIFSHAGITNVMIEDLNGTIILDTNGGSNGTVLPATGDYIMNVWQTGGAAYGIGLYDFSLIIE